MLRITTLLSNLGLLILSIYGLTQIINDPEVTFMFGFLIPLLILSILNIYFVIGTYKGPVSLYLKRKKLEEEIKIQEAENRLKDLQSQRSDFSKEKNKNGII